MGKPGQTAPAFSLPGTDGEEVKKYSLSEYTEKGALVLVFYPFDFSPGSAEVLSMFRDAEFLSFTDNVDVLGISRDSAYAHKQFMHEYEIPFPLLSDTTGAVTAEYGLEYDELDHHEGVPKTALVTIDDDHTVRYKWATDTEQETPTPDEIHDTVLALENDRSSRDGSSTQRRW